MFRRFSVNFALLSMGIDVILVCLALAIATQIRPLLSAIPFSAHYPEYISTPWLVYPIFAFEWVAILLLFSVYDGRRNFRTVDEITSLTLGSILATVASAGTLFLTFRDVSRLLFILFALITYILLVGWRLVARMAFSFNLSNTSNQRRILIIGTSETGKELQKQIHKQPEFGLEVVGFVDKNPLPNSEIKNLLGSFNEVKSIIKEFNINDVVIALPQSAYADINRIVSELHTLAVKVWIIPDYFRLALHKAAIEEVGGMPLLDLRAPALTDYQRLVKRAFDLLVSILLLPFSLIAMLVISIAIRLESLGPILFRQERVGENGHIFEMLKFRTMVPEAENMRNLVEHVNESGQIIHKTSDDPRVTRVGRILRRTSLDELPQMLNVFKGDMSLVGPRPEMPYLVEKYKLWQRARFAVPQGITGWWQIQGRSDKPMHLNTDDDLYYVQNYSLLLDISILLKTIGVVIRGEGAF